MIRDNTTTESREWRHARQSAFVEEVLSVFMRHPAGLMSFEDVHQKLKLGNLHYLGLQEVPLDQIVGSVGRYTDFTRAFFPRQDHLQARWQRIEQLVAAGRDLPPIELYRIGQVYFVRDGNHRVSVARQHGKSSLKACVWECETSIPLEPNSDIDDLLCKTAHAAFVECTNIDRLCLGAQIRLTQPDGYEDLLREIQTSQQIFAGIDGRDIASDEAVTLWYEIRYFPIVEIIRQCGVLQYFPGRTEADLYLWLRKNLQELEASYGRQILGQEAARDLSKRFGQSSFPVVRLKGAVRWLASVATAWASDLRRTLPRALGRRRRP